MREGGHVFSAVDAEQVVGVVALFRTSHRSFELARMAVDVTRRGEGIGRELERLPDSPEWQCLGHDICDETGKRGHMNCGFEDGER